MNSPLPRLLAGLLLVTALVLPGCGGSGGSEDAAPKLRLAYVNWAEGIAMTHLVEAILEERLGYEVELTMADVAPVFTAVATGQADAFLDVWKPVTHAEYLKRYSEKLDDLGANYEGAKIGLVVPDGVEARSIPDLAKSAEAFDGKIVGIDSGAGIMGTTEKALEAYGLEGMELMASSGPAMTAALKGAVEDGDPIVVTGWKPHWKFARWELRFLEDPKKVFGEAEAIHTVVRKGLKEEDPKAYGLLDRFRMTGPQLASLMDAVTHADGEPEKAARKWMKEHADLVAGWLGDAGNEKAAAAGEEAVPRPRPRDLPHRLPDHFPEGDRPPLRLLGLQAQRLEEGVDLRVELDDQAVESRAGHSPRHTAPRRPRSRGGLPPSRIGAPVRMRVFAPSRDGIPRGPRVRTLLPRGLPGATRRAPGGPRPPRRHLGPKLRTLVLELALSEDSTGDPGPLRGSPTNARRSRAAHA